jgi:hypothetical protein
MINEVRHEEAGCMKRLRRTHTLVSQLLTYEVSQLLTYEVSQLLTYEVSQLLTHEALAAHPHIS